MISKTASNERRSSRDGFSRKTVFALAQRAGFRCSNPTCQRATVGAAPTKDSVINVGVGAHLTAASTGGPRYDPALTSEQRGSAENGIWLCQICAKFVDDDERYFSLEVLLVWKAGAEGRSFEAVTSFAGASPIQRICMAPLERLSPSYTGRAAISASIAERIAAGASTIVLTGTGGVGKTQIALHHAHIASTHRHVFWLVADDDAGLLRGWRNAAQLLGIEGAQWIPNDELEFKLFNWFRTHRDWLVVFDNYEPDRVAQLSRWLLLPSTGTVLITSREQDVTRDLFGKPIQVPPFTEQEATEFLLRSTPSQSQSAESRKAAHLIATMLQGLPLALEQAAVSVRAGSGGYAGYLKKLEGGALLPSQGALQEALDRGLDQLSAVDGAPEALAAMAFLAPDSIDIALLKGIVRSGSKSATEIGPALEAARRYSLVERIAPERVAIHRLVQTRIRERLSPSAAVEVLGQTIEALVDLHPVDPENFGNRSTCAALLPHILAVNSHASSLASTAPLATLLELGGRFAAAAGLFESADTLLVASVTRGSDVHGEHDESVLSLRSRLAGLYRRTGRMTLSRKAYQDVIDRRIEKHGRANHSVAIALNNLGNVLYDDGDLIGAEKAYRAAEKIWREIDMAESPDAALTMNGLANVLRQQGVWDEANHLYRSAIHIWRDSDESVARHLGFAQNGLGNLLLDQGNIDDAIEQYMAADDSWKELGGVRHPDRGYALHNLGKAYAALGDDDRAMGFYREALEIRGSALGPQHRLYILTRGHLAGMEARQGRTSSG